MISLNSKKKLVLKYVVAGLDIFVCIVAAACAIFATKPASMWLWIASSLCWGASAAFYIADIVRYHRNKRGDT